MMLPHAPVVPALLSLVFALPASIAAVKALGTRRGLGLIGGLVLFATVLEIIAVKTGFPYGYFWYGDALAPKIFGTVPLLVGVSWLPLFLGAAALANRARVAPGIPFMLTVALIMLAADLVLDPGAVAEGFWAYRNGGFYFDVPLSNFVGWMFSSSLAAFFFPTSLKSEYAVAGLMTLVGFFTVVDIAHGFLIPAIFGVIGICAVAWFDLWKRGYQK